MSYEVSPNRPAAAAEERSLGELFGDLARETSTLVKQEVGLAKTELTEKATRVGKDVGYLAMGGAVAYAGMLTLIAALVLILTAIGLPIWASALLVGLVVAGVGGSMAMKGLKQLKNVDPVPHQTVETLKEDKEWAKQQVR